MSTGSRIRARREALGRRQYDLAQACGVSAALICHYESDDREPRLGTLRLLAQAMHCKVADLIEDEDPPPMVVCPTCSGHGAIPRPVAERMSGDVLELVRLRVQARRGEGGR